MGKKFTFLIILILLIYGCTFKKEEEKISIKKENQTYHDVELENWRKEFSKESYSIELDKIKNPFITPQMYKKLAQRESQIPLQLVGIIRSKNKKMALLQDPTKKGYIVKEGEKLGESTIKEIGDNYIIIEEISENIFGQKTKKVRKITLIKEERQ